MTLDPGKAKRQLSRGQRRGRLFSGAHSEAYAQHIVFSAIATILC